MTLDELKLAWEEDCSIDEGNVSKSSALSPNLHAKYLNELIGAKLKLTKIQIDLNKLRVAKAKYFRGEMTKEELDEYGWEQWHYRTLKSSIETMVDADEAVITLFARESYMKVVIYFLESVLGEIRTRSFHCKNIIEWTKFRAGA